MFTGERDTIIDVVEKKLNQHREELSGQERLGQAAANEYQDEEELDRYTRGLNGALDRRQAARQLLLDRPVTVSDAMGCKPRVQRSDSINPFGSEMRSWCSASQLFKLPVDELLLHRRTTVDFLFHAFQSFL